MNYRGFALLAVLWVLTALSALTGAGMLVARLGQETTRNRVLLARAEWGREGCGEILQARFAADPSTRHLDPVVLGRGTWCRASLDDPHGKLNVNSADRNALVTLLRAVGAPRWVADSAIAARGRAPIYDLTAIPGMDSALTARVQPYLTTRGTGAIDVAAASAPVLRLLPGMTDESVFLLLSRRTTRPIRNADELAGLLSRSARAVFLAQYADFVRATVFEPPQLVVRLEGGVRGSSIVARATLTVVPVVGRLAVIRRETE
jgi:type II secretory pathway component PulK